MTSHDSGLLTGHYHSDSLKVSLIMLYSGMNQKERNQHRVRNFAKIVFAVVQTTIESYINI